MNDMKKKKIRDLSRMNCRRLDFPFLGISIRAMTDAGSPLLIDLAPDERETKPT